MEEYLQMKVKELSNLDGLERPTFCLTWSFQLICFTDFPYLEITCPRVCREPKSIFVQMKTFINSFMTEDAITQKPVH